MNERGMGLATGDLVLELIGREDVLALRATVGDGYLVQLWPYARLGDFIVQLRPKIEGELDALLGRLRAGGWTVLGGRRHS